MSVIAVREWIAGADSALPDYAGLPPWALTAAAADIVRAIVAQCGDDYRFEGEAAIHRSAEVERGATLKGPTYVGPDCFIASGALLRGGCWLERGCIVGPGGELKTSFMFAGSKLAHLNFVGDSVLGAGVNVEAGAMIANYRNERSDKRIRIRRAAALIDTGVDKFGALVGDGARIGANAVIAPGAIIGVNEIVPRLGLIDQS